MEHQIPGGPQFEFLSHLYHFGEDISLNRYFDLKGQSYNYYEGIRVRKQETTYDSDSTYVSLNREKEKLAAFFAAAESSVPSGVPTAATG